MGRYLIIRLMHAAMVIWGAATLVFLILHLAPGDPALNLVGEMATEEQIARVRTSLGLDRPLHLAPGDDPGPATKPLARRD